MNRSPRVRGDEPTPQLPALEPGIQLLTVPDGIGRAIHALVVDHVLLSGGDAHWVDTGHSAQTAPLVEFASGRRILDRIHVARGFTPFQHRALLDGLSATVTDRTELVVVPGIDRPYRGDDLLANEGRDLLLTAVAALARVARDRDCPVLVTRSRVDEFSRPVETAATRTIHCEATEFGPRFRTDDTETLVYPTDGASVQTTLAFWERVLTARQPLYDAGEVTARGAN